MEAQSDQSGQRNDEIETHIPLQRSPSLYLINDTPKGRGVFSRENISQGTVIDVCPVLVFQPEENRAHIAKTQLYHYTYNWPVSASDVATGENQMSSKPTSISESSDPDDTVINQPRPRPATQIPSQALVLGLGSLFNHRSANTTSLPLTSSTIEPAAGPNVGWRRNLQHRTVTYLALRDISAGEELCISYGEKLTFVDVDSDADGGLMMNGNLVEDLSAAEGDDGGAGMLGRISLGCLDAGDGD